MTSKLSIQRITMHSYISNTIEIKNEKIERYLCVTDSMLELFMHFFDRVANEQHQLTNELEEITKHYDIEMTGVHGSFIDLKVEEIYNNKIAFEQYLNILNKIEVVLKEEFREFVNADYLNNAKNYRREGNNISAKKVILFLNDLRWLMNIKGIIASNNWKWYEEKVEK